MKRALEGADPAAQRQALEDLARLDPTSRQEIVPTVLKLAGEAKDLALREAATRAIRTAMGPVAYPRAVVEQIQGQCECRLTGTTTHQREPDGHIRVKVRVVGNGCSFLVIRPER